MNSGQTVFAQLIEFLPKHVFRKCVLRYKGDYRCRKFSCRDQFLCVWPSPKLLIAKVFGISRAVCVHPVRNSSGLESAAKFLEARWPMRTNFATIAFTKTSRCIWSPSRKGFTARNRGDEISSARCLHSMPRRSICACQLFPWAKFRKRKGAVKVHALIDVVTRIPTVIRVTPGNIHEVRILDELCFEPECDLPDGSWVCLFQTAASTASQRCVLRNSRK